MPPAAWMALLLCTGSGAARPAAVTGPLRSPTPAPSSYLVPAVGQTGGPVRITGAFDGDLSTSSVRIGGQAAQPMAESPRQLVVRGPEAPAPPAPIEVSERGKVVATGTYRSVSVRLSAPLTNLLAGQHTTLTVTVSGVQSLQETLPVQKATAASGERRFDEMGFAAGSSFAVRGDGGKSRLVLTASEGAFSIEASSHPREGREQSFAPLPA